MKTDSEQSSVSPSDVRAQSPFELFKRPIQEISNLSDKEKQEKDSEQEREYNEHITNKQYQKIAHDAWTMAQRMANASIDWKRVKEKCDKVAGVAYEKCKATGIKKHEDDMDFEERCFDGSWHGANEICRKPYVDKANAVFVKVILSFIPNCNKIKEPSIRKKCINRLAGMAQENGAKVKDLEKHLKDKYNETYKYPGWGYGANR